MKRLLVFFWFVIVLHVHGQQIVFNKVYDFGFELEIGGAVIVEDDGYVVGGRTTSRRFNGWDSFRVFKIDSIGDIVWNNEGGILGYDVDFGASGSLIKTYDDKYVWGGGGFDTASIIYDVFLLKFDQNGDPIFAKKYGSAGHDRGYSVAEAKDKGYAIFGQTKGLGDSQGDYYLVKTDSNGSFEWEKTYNVAKDLGITIDNTPDGGFILGGGVRNRSTNNQDAYIIKTDSAGNMEWDKVFGSPQGNDCGGGAFSISNNQYMLISCLDTVINPQNSAPRYVAKLDSFGNILWRNFFTIPDQHSLLMIRELADGNFICAGHLQDKAIQETRVGWILKLDSAGNILWERRYGQPSEFFSSGFVTAELWDIQPANDGGFIAVGKTFETHTADFWVLKLDSNGCLGDYCGLTDTSCYYQPWPCEDDTVGVEGDRSQKSEIRIYPNPAKNEFKVEGLKFGAIYKLQLYDMLGRKVLISQITGESKTAHTDKLESGIYFYAIHEKDSLLPLGTGKVVIE